jgi:hypothetical protein
VNEDDILTRVALEAALAPLEPDDRDMLLIAYGIWQPDDWGARPWPARLEDVGDYIGLKYGVAPLSEAAIRYRQKALEERWAGRRGPLRRSRKRPPPAKGV